MGDVNWCQPKLTLRVKHLAGTIINMHRSAHARGLRDIELKAGLFGRGWALSP
jgi:hypothetical protein